MIDAPLSLGACNISKRGCDAFHHREMTGSDFRGPFVGYFNLKRLSVSPLHLRDARVGITAVREVITFL